MFDVAVIGGGPAGLAAATSAATEGLSVVVLCERLGGQAGTSSLIENFLGFPEGISGPDLTARALAQAEKFGAQFKDCLCSSLEHIGGLYRMTTASGEVILARSVIVASGAMYQRLPETTGYAKFEGKGVHYACAQNTALPEPDAEVVVVGGGNSAGQAAMFLSTKAKRVHLVVRRDNIVDTMSEYLIERLYGCSSVKLHFRTIVHAILGDEHVNRVILRELDDGFGTAEHVVSATDVYVMIGAKPNCAFVEGLCKLDSHGFIETDDFFQTDRPGLFAVGDVRAGSVKRVANAVGEGSSAVRWLWRHLFGDKQ